MNKSFGFSLLELMIVISITVLIAMIGVGFYTNYGKSVELNSITSSVVSDLKQVRSKSMVNEGGFKWGIHFVNADKDYYEIFSTPTDYTNSSKVITSTNYLSGGVDFLTPSSGSSKDIIFNKISGGTSDSSIILLASNISKTINVSSIGNISISDGSSSGSNSYVEPTNVLTWAGTNGPSAMTWNNATAYCSGLGTGWRLPTISEYSVIPSNSFPYGSYWTSTESGDTAWFWNSWGDAGRYYTKSYAASVRCVH